MTATKQAPHDNEPDAGAPVALVTGGSAGLGLALVRDLAADGWHVVTDGRRPEQLAAAKVRSVYRAEGRRSIRWRCEGCMKRNGSAPPPSLGGWGLHALRSTASCLGSSR